MAMPVNSTPLEIAMITFEVNDMTCGHCVSTITKALKATDKDADSNEPSKSKSTWPLTV
jgi:copper chaperone CopZ